MSFSHQNLNQKKIKAKKSYKLEKQDIPINPEILSYIQNIQDENGNINHSGNQKSTQAERMIPNKLIDKNEHPTLVEDLTYEKDKRFKAKKGLLYLLNSLSNNTFCPDIENYFSQMKEAKIEELKKKSSFGNSEFIKEEDLKRDIKNYDLMQERLGREKNNQEIDEKILNMGKNTPINMKFGLKKYNNDYDTEDLINLYDKLEIKDNTFQINYNKEKRYKMKLKNKSKKSDN